MRVGHIIIAAGAAFAAWIADEPALAQEAALAQEVRVSLAGVEARSGKILATLQNEQQFLREAGAHSLLLDPPAGGGALELVFADVAPGEYALSVMHDEDGDFQMRTQAGGMPAEGYAMSNGGMMTGPPDWNIAKFSVGDQAVRLEEQMYYPYAPPSAE